MNDVEIYGDKNIKKGYAFHFDNNSQLHIVEIPLKPIEEVEKLIECERQGTIHKYSLELNKNDLMNLEEAELLIKQIQQNKKQFHNKIIETFSKNQEIEDFSILVSYEDIKNKNYSFSAGQYFDVKIEYVDITAEEFEAKMNEYQSNLKEYFKQSHELENELQKQLELLKYE